MFISRARLGSTNEDVCTSLTRLKIKITLFPALVRKYKRRHLYFAHSLENKKQGLCPAINLLHTP